MREEAVWAAWLSMDPGVMSYDRDPLACTVSHNTAAWLMGLGELEPEPVTLTCPVRFPGVIQQIALVCSLISGSMDIVAS